MSRKQRRQFLQHAAQATSALLLPAAIQRALALPAVAGSGSLKDVGHVVILTQENRSFDHYFGTLRGVRGFGDRFPVPLPSALPKALQLTPLCASLPSTISTILASSITWRSIEICTAFR